MAVDAENNAVGGGIAVDVGATDVWLFANVVDEASQDTYENQLWATRVDCTSAGCYTTGSISWVQLGATRSGLQANTAPSLAVDPDLDRLHFTAMEDDASCGGAGVENAIYHEWVYTYAFSAIAEYNVDDGGCDEDWGHGLVTYNATATEMVSTSTWKDGDDDAVFGLRDIGTTTWTTPPSTVVASESDHISQAYRVSNGNNRFAYHDIGGDDIIFGSGSQEVDIGDGNWPVLIFDDVNSPAAWRVAWAEESGSDTIIKARKCNVTEDCFDIDNWSTIAEPVTQVNVNHIRAIDYGVASDGSLHLFWLDDNGSNDEYQYARKCPAGEWSAATELWHNPNQGAYLDIGRPHMAFYQDTVNAVMVVFPDWSLGNEGDLIWAKHYWEC